MKIVEAVNLKKQFGSGEAAVQALDGVSLRADRGEFIAVVGTSGSGKSTLLHILGGLDVPDSGQVWINGQELGAMSQEKLTIFRRRNIGFVFQQYNLVPMLNVQQNILLPMKLDGRKPDPAYLEEIIGVLKLEDKLKSRPGTLSGGQQQRVAIARALITRPAVLLADEPTGNLDSKTSQDVLGLLKVTGDRLSQTMIMITHNEEIAQLADRILHLEDGRLVEEG